LPARLFNGYSRGVTHIRPRAAALAALILLSACAKPAPQQQVEPSPLDALTLACDKGRLVVTRPIVAELGAGALFAIEGPRRIVRIPVDATAIPGQRGYVWQGSMDGTDDNTDVFTGPFTGTLPGGGLIKVSTGEAARDVVHRCHAAKRG